MSDDLDDLKSAFGAATPAPDAARRAENLALAQKNFEALQGSRDTARPTPVTAPNGLWTGFKNMLTSMTSRGALTATTALVACGFLLLTDTGQGLWQEGDFATDFGADLTAQVNNEVGSSSAAETTRPPELQPQVTFAPPASAEPSGSVDDFALNQNGFTEDLFFGDVRQQDRSWVSAGDLEADSLDQVLRGDPSFDDSAVTARRQSTPAPAAPRVAQSEEPPSVAEALSDDSQFYWEGNLSTGESQATGNGLEAGAYFEITVDEPVVMLEAIPSAAPQTPNTEAFANEAPASLKITQETPVSTFSIDVDTASYSVMRSSITRGILPQPDQVRIEELINYFPYDYPAPDAGEAPFRPTVSTMQTPWNADTQLVHIAIQGQMPSIDDRPPLNLVFLIDTSGSMNQPNKLPLLKQSFRLMLGQLRPEDQVAIVAYAGSAGQVLAPTPASDQASIINALNGLAAGGGTNGQGGLQQAYAIADQMAEEGEVSRVILATDGDFNVGINNPEALKDFIADKRDTGTYLSVLGFGRGNLDDATMQALAQNGNGQAAYIDTLTEAQKVLVDQLTGALFPIAGDVKIQVEWNPAEVAEYRLIGYETRALAREDFNNDKVDAGELGAGHSVTAIYEVTPVGSPAQLSDPLRYAPAQVAESTGEMGFLKLRYKDPGATDSQLLTTPIVPSQGASSDATFAVAIAGFGQLLRDDRFLREWGYAELIALANANRGDDPFGYRTEAVQLMRLAQSLAGDHTPSEISR